MVVALPSSCVRALSCCGSRCCTRTNPNPVLVGKCVSSSVNASNPPADAPTPTIGKRFAAVAARGGAWLLLDGHFLLDFDFLGCCAFTSPGAICRTSSSAKRRGSWVDYFARLSFSQGKCSDSPGSGRSGSRCVLNG